MGENRTSGLLTLHSRARVSAVRSFSNAEVLKITNAVSVLGLDLADFEVSPLMVSGSELEGLDVQAPWQAAAPAHASAT